MTHDLEELIAAKKELEALKAKIEQRERAAFEAGRDHMYCDSADGDVLEFVHRTFDDWKKEQGEK